MNWWSGWKVGKTNFGWSLWVQNSQNCPKYISREPLVLESWLTSQNNCNTGFTMGGLRYVYPSDKWKCTKNTIFYFLGLIMTKLHDSSYRVNLLLNKIGWLLKVTTRVDLHDFFSGLIWLNFKSYHITWTIYHVKLADFSKWIKGPLFY